MADDKTENLIADKPSIVDDMLRFDDLQPERKESADVIRSTSVSTRLPMAELSKDDLKLNKQSSNNSNNSATMTATETVATTTAINAENEQSRTTTMFQSQELKKFQANLVKRSTTTNLQMQQIDTWKGCCTSLFKTENDLFGFSLIWVLGMIILLVLYFHDYSYMHENEVTLASIIMTPIIVSAITWVFSWSITRFQKDGSIEAVNRARFLVPFGVKVFSGSCLYFWMFFTSGGVYDRIQDEDDYNDACWYSLASVFVCMVVSLATTELMITTVMVNAAQNLRDDIPYNWSIFLFFTRPLVWVYNRTICMFVSFYIYFGAACTIFGVGSVTTIQCTNSFAAGMYQVGLYILLAPFVDPLYLLDFEGFYYEKFDNVKMVTVITQQVLLWTTIVDVLNSIYVSLRYVVLTYKRTHVTIRDPENPENPDRSRIRSASVTANGPPGVERLKSDDNYESDLVGLGALSGNYRPQSPSSQSVGSNAKQF